MTKFLIAVVAAMWLCTSAASAAPAPDTGSASVSSARTAPTDISAARKHYRYVNNRWRVVKPYPTQPYPTYGYYGPRPRLYRPYPYYIPVPFGFGFGFDPNY